MAKLTFKRHKKETGLRAVGNHHPWVDIKLNKKHVGNIVPPSAFSDHDDFLIRLMVVDSREACGWKWIQLKFRAKNEAKAREYIVKHDADIQGKFNLRLVDDV